MTDQSPMISNVPAGGLCMQPRALSTFVALVANFAVLAVFGRHENLESGESLVGQDAEKMPECGGCKKVREKENKAPRMLTRLPLEVTQNKDFQRKGLPVQLCEYCDGDALEEAVKAHHKRTSQP